MDRNGEILLSKIKKENADEDIKEFAETAMNELLGWYGYGATREEAPSKIPISSSCRSRPGSNSSDPDSPKYADGCEWCGKPVDESKGLSSTGGTFCSELCFSQSRRANFKKNKTCDWCRHVRHTVSYVDFQDGASQLQFCSDKCLNQYKMHIFCRETRAHLEIHPHLPDDVTTNNGGGGGLITPDLWLKNCKSPEPLSSSPPISPKITDNLPQTSPLPLITVAHPSKFMDTPETNKRQRNKAQKRSRKRCSATVTCSPASKSPPSTEIPQDLRVRHTPPAGSFESLQYREDPRTANMFSRNFPDPFRVLPQSHLFNGLPNPHSRLFNQPQLPPPPPQPPQLPPPSPLHNLLPPVTVLVPYPIIIPLPLPLPIPIPIPCDAKNINKPEESVNKDAENNSSDRISTVSQNDNKSRNDVELEATVSAVEEKEKPNKINEEIENKQNEEVANKCVETINGTQRPFRKRKRIVVENNNNKNKIASPVKNKKSVPA